MERFRIYECMDIVQVVRGNSQVGQLLDMFKVITGPSGSFSLSDSANMLLEYPHSWKYDLQAAGYTLSQIDSFRNAIDHINDYANQFQNIRVMPGSKHQRCREWGVRIASWLLGFASGLVVSRVRFHKRA